MFTGLIADIGKILEIRRRGDAWLKIACSRDSADVARGASICCSGVCLTALESRREDDVFWFRAQASRETLDRTTIGSWKVGTEINLERSLRMGDELGGHLVSGHVDGTARIAAIEERGASKRFSLEAPDELARFIAPKGSIALDGTSLTVNKVNGAEFDVNLVAHSLEATTWKNALAGDMVNVEIDMLARYVARLIEFRKV